MTEERAMVLHGVRIAHAENPRGQVRRSTAAWGTS